MRDMTLTTDGFGIPDFLRVTPEIAEQRRKWNAEHPARAANFSGETEERQREVEAARSRQKEEDRVRKCAELNALHERKLREARGETPQQFAVARPGMIWNATLGKWVLPSFMSAAKHARLYREMPSAAHRAEFVKQFGPGQGGLDEQDVTHHARESAVKPAGDTSGKSRSVHKDAGRVRVPSGSTASDTAPVKRSPTSTNKPPAGGDWKTGVIEMLRRPEGATLAEIAAAYGWQEHSASARLSAIRKERTITATAEERGRVYRME